MLFIDIDHFKRINDSFGHAAGDQVIVEVARRIEQALRATDLLFRWGGEEFVALMPHTRPEETRPIAERIRTSVESSPFLEGRPEGDIRVSVSVGAAAATPSDDPGGLLQAADARCLLAKERGRNQVVVA